MRTGALPGTAAVPDDPSARARICVVGTGALGSTVLERLRGRGFRSVLLVDPDAVEERNLELSPLLRRADEMARPATLADENRQAERNKADLLAAAARTLDQLPWRSAPMEIADVGWRDFDDVNLFCCCTDNILSRIETSWIARALGKPLLDAGVAGQGIAAGRVTSLPPQAEAPCFLCTLSESRRAAVLGYAASTSLGCQLPEAVPAMTATFGALNQIADVMFEKIVTWAASSAASAHTLRLSQAANGEWQHEFLSLTRSANCPWHEQPSAELRNLSWGEPLDVSMPETGWDVVLNWPVCTDAVCAGCNTRSRPMKRVARVRRALCPTCGQATQEPMRAIHRIRSGTSESRLSPRQLGMPDRHLYWVRQTAGLQIAKSDTARQHLGEEAATP
jgi:molybdopterin-synthase adenylyltransferase